MKKIMKRSKSSPLNLTPGARVHTPRNGFDMSYSSYFTAPIGALQPCYVQEVDAGDYLNLTLANMTRTMPVNTAAFPSFKENVDFYFVPYRLIWKWFDNFLVQVDDTVTSLTPFGNGNKIPSSVPKLSAGAISTAFDSAAPTDIDIHGFRLADGYERLLDLLGFSTSNKSAVSAVKYWDNMTKLPTPTWFNPFRLAAYQRIFFDYYRNTDYTPIDAPAFNLDDLKGGDEVTSARFKKMATLRYVQWRKDRLTSVKPSSLRAMMSFGDTYPKNVDGLNHFNNIESFNNHTLMDVGSGLSAQELRAMLAVDKVARVTMLSGKTYEEQMKAHFGVTPDNCDYCSTRYLGSFDSQLNIGEVTATASGADTQGSDNVLGQLAGKGLSIGKTNRPIRGEFNEPGIVMGLHYVLPYSEYDSNRIDDFCKKLVRNDYFQPEYDNLGMQPLFGYSRGIDVTFGGGNEMNNVIGFQGRYLEYKTRIDEVHSEFQSGRSLSAWNIPRNAQLAPGSMTSERDFYVNPKVADTIFSLKYNGKQLSDPLLCNYAFKAHLVSNKSVLGTPSM